MPRNVGVYVVNVDAVEAEVDNVEAGPLVGEKAALGGAFLVSRDQVGQLDPLLQLPGFHFKHEDVSLPLGYNPDMTSKLARMEYSVS